jgi:outer membrane protein assembly factor BamB
MPALSPEKPSQPLELPPGVWEPPPVRRGTESQEQAIQPVEEMPDDEVPQPPVSKRRAKFAIASLIGVVIVVFCIAGFSLWNALHKSEARLSAEAHGYYEQGSFSEARSRYETLVNNFKASENRDKYRFMTEWCNVCSTVSKPDADLPTAAAELERFVREHKKDAPMAQVSHDAGQRLLQLVKGLVARSANPTDEAPLAAVERIEQARRTMAALGSDALTPAESRQIDVELGKVRKAVELWLKRRDTLAQIKLRDKETPMDAIKRSHSMLARVERELPGISQEAKSSLDQLEKIHLESVRYQSAKDAPPPPPEPPGDDGEVMVFAPLLQAFPDKAPPNDPIMLGLVRGVLYALKQSNGEFKWATHVGIDTTVLPQRVPRSAISPELILVLSADTQTLSALNVEGVSVWEYAVGQPVLGRPIIIDQRAYLADFSGWVHEIELSRGQLLGRWFLGQPLTCGGTREEGTSRIYFPADDSCIYVLDVNPKVHRCVTILYDGHPSGSLRSEPVVIPPEGDNAPGYLILNQASGLDTTSLRVFELPIQDSHAQPLALSSQVRLAGWTWFKPKEDGEKLAVLSDAGFLGLFGIKQLGNNDPPLFPLLRGGELDLSSFLRQPAMPVKGREPLRERSRSLVVHMRSDDMWVLAHGRFQQLHLRMTQATGPEVVPGWKTALELGSPLHEPQRLEDRNGRSTFFLVTQALNQQTCLATAVNEEGRTLWQRQLGSVCQGQPLALTPPGGGPPLLVMLDEGGGLFVLDPQQPLDKLRVVQQALAPALAENPRMPPLLLRAADGHSAYEIASPGDGKSLIVRYIEWSDNGRELRVNKDKSKEVSLESPGDNGVLIPAGLPAVTTSQLLIPMNDGNVHGLSLIDEQATLQTGPSWSRSQTHVLAPSILALDHERFLIANGNRGLAVYEWPSGKGMSWQGLPKGSDPLTLLEYLMVAPPVLLQPEGNNQPARVIVADSAGMLRLFTVTPEGALQPGLPWELKGNLTAGPFVQETPDGGWRIGCVLDRNRLLWIDPEKDQPLWTYSTGGPAIVGQPQQVEGMLVIALQSGRYVGIDPATGKAKGSGYLLRTSAAPAAVPMPFGPGRMFAPLSDGTALLLSVDLLKKN